MAKKATSGRSDTPPQFSIPAELLEHLLLGPADDRRVLQDSPLLGDVWAAYALDAGKVRDVLITPHKDATAAGVARKIPGGLKLREEERRGEQDPAPANRDKVPPKIAYLQGLVAARLYFDEVLRILVPMTYWWYLPNVMGRIDAIDPEKLKRLLRRDMDRPGMMPSDGEPREIFTSLERYIALAGLIYWITKLERPKEEGATVKDLPARRADEAFKIYQTHVDQIVEGMLRLYSVVKKAANAAEKQRSGKVDEDDYVGGMIFQVSLNRTASAALERSIPAVKADAAHSLFKVNCKDIVWAVLDSGIDGQHDAFMSKKKPAEQAQADKQGKTKKKARQKSEYVTRVKKTFDFAKIREIISDADDLTEEERKQIADAAGLSPAVAQEYLESIAKNAREGFPLNWAVVEKLITIRNPKPPASPHGTHVAGIIGAAKFGKGDPGYSDGMCPDIQLYDFRVLGKTRDETEFAVIAALQFIRYVNERHNFTTIHGANLSLSIPHSVRNFACGRTPVCNECERLVESGVVVVAAAGNHGFQKFETNDGLFESYAAFSITDPGNADSVITVGSTHSIWPHTYGVSFFSSRGPTGDGRLKPDLVAPGERIQSAVHSHGGRSEWAPESGTSMAAPHVSGAAAMLLARYEELIGQPRRVKRILCETATDLGRDRTFQGHGMLDVLRAFQSI
jgi:serine protease AprX